MILNQKQRPSSSSSQLEGYIRTKGSDTLAEEVVALKHRLKSCEDKMTKSIGSKKISSVSDSRLSKLSIKSELTRAQEILKSKTTK